MADGKSAPWIVMKREENDGMYAAGVTVPTKLTPVAPAIVLLSSKVTAFALGSSRSWSPGSRLDMAG